MVKLTRFLFSFVQQDIRKDTLVQLLYQAQNILSYMNLLSSDTYLKYHQISRKSIWYDLKRNAPDNQFYSFITIGDTLIITASDVGFKIPHSMLSGLD